METQPQRKLRIVFCFLLFFSNVKHNCANQIQYHTGFQTHPLPLNYLSRTKPRIICFHGHESNGATLKKQMSLWPDTVLDELDLVFLDGPYQVQHSSHEDTSDPPYYDWFQSDEKFGELIGYVETNMIKYGPFDGILGFSEGGVLAASLPAIQRERVVLTKIPRIKFVIVIAGAKLGAYKNGQLPEMAVNLYSSPINCPSLHFIGETDPIAKDVGIDLLNSFVDPVVIHHPEGHVIPQLDNNSLEVVLSFIEKTRQNSEQE